MITKISCVVPYLNDILVYSKKFEDHRYKRLKLRRLRKKGVKMKKSKWNVFQRQAAFQVMLFQKKGVVKIGIIYWQWRSATQKLEAPPSNIGEVRCLLGLVRYFRHHVVKLQTHYMISSRNQIIKAKAYNFLGSSSSSNIRKISRNNNRST